MFSVQSSNNRKIKDQLIQQNNENKWNAQIRNNSLVIEYHDNITYQGTIKENSYINLQEIKQIIDRGEAKIISKSYTQIKIRIIIITLVLHNEDYRQIQKLNKKVQELQQKVKTLQWEEEDLNSTAPFDVNCLYKVVLNNNSSVTSHYVDQNYIYYNWTNGSIYNTQKSNRRASSTGSTVIKIFKQKCG